MPRAYQIFQSTRPIRGATGATAPRPSGRHHFNPRAPYGARRCRSGIKRRYANISIHAPHTGRDRTACRRICRVPGFQSTRPIRGATIKRITRAKQKQNFNPRAPYGARLGRGLDSLISPQFQSTRPIRGATVALDRDLELVLFQSTRPIRGATVIQLMRSCVDYLFQSTRPIRGATLSGMLLILIIRNFNPRAPYGARPCQ